MHVKDLAARYEAAAAKPLPSSHPPRPETPSARVRELRDKLEAAVERAKQDDGTDAPPATIEPNETSAAKPLHHPVDAQPATIQAKKVFAASDPASRSSTLSSTTPETTIPQKELEQNQLSHSPRAVEAVDFPPPPSLETVPQSVAAARDLWTGKAAAQAGNGSGDAPVPHPVLPDPRRNADRVVRPDESGASFSAQHPSVPEYTRRVRSSAKSSSTYDPEALSPGTSRDFSSAYASENFDLIQPIEDISDDDLDNIDGVEHVEDFDSQDADNADNDDDTGDTFHRAQTVEILDDDNEPGPGTDSSRSGDHYKSEAKVSSHSGTPSGTTSGRSSGFDNESLEREAVANVMDDLDDSEGFVSAASNFTKSSTSGFTSRVSSRRPRPRSTDDRILPLSAAGSDFLRLASQAGSLNVDRHSMDRPNNGSLKRLPKAKVVIARRRGQSLNLDGSDDEGLSVLPLQQASLSMDESGPRRLVREYSNPKELLAGQISMLDLGSDENKSETDHEETGQAPPPVAIPSKFPYGRRQRENAYKHHYDEFLDAEGLQRPVKVISDEDPTLEAGNEENPSKSGNSKQRYRMRLFGGKGVPKAQRDRQRVQRHERHVDSVQRRSTMISGALDRVSMAADPWIDFITDANALPGVSTGRRPFRNAMKRLFRRRQPELIKGGEL